MTNYKNIKTNEIITIAGLSTCKNFIKVKTKDNKVKQYGHSAFHQQFQKIEEESQNEESKNY